MTHTLLVELLTEELPPRALRLLGEVFARELAADLDQDGFLAPASTQEFFATPRRLAVLITAVAAQAPDSEVLVKGPSIKAGLDSNGKPTPALLGFARKRGIAVEALERSSDGKQEVFAHRDLAKGADLETNLDIKIEAALKRLPIPKVMRWSDGDTQFVRPVHGLVMMHGSRVVPGEVLGLKSSNRTLGHRFLGSGPITLSAAADYERALRDEGNVIASFRKRRGEIEHMLTETAGKNATIAADDALLDEVTALTEAPIVYKGSFSPEFLEVPQECLILSMKQHQKYFPLLDEKTGKLLPRFLMVSNLRADDPSNIIHGNERVLRARLSDAKFFYDQDRKVRLEERVPQLANAVYHNKLGSQLQRVARIQLLAGRIARELGADALLAERAAWLSKADLLTGMVGEFPELQGTMGRYYALHDGEPREVADAIEAHYHPRFAGDTPPDGKTACAVALADKLDALVGIFGVGGAPTGEKDPFALRRAALGIIRILSEQKLPLALDALIEEATANFSGVKLDAVEVKKVFGFSLDRLRGYLRDREFEIHEIEAVVSQAPSRIDLVVPRLRAVQAFKQLPEAEALASANKRIRNILRQARETIPTTPDPDNMPEEVEKALYGMLERVEPIVEAEIARDDFAGALQRLASMRNDVDRFFDHVLVMADDVTLRRNRLALLSRLNELMNRVADISKLAA